MLTTHTSMPHTHTTQPIVTGTSVVGIKFRGGVVLAADKLASYGSLRRFTNEPRLFKVGEQTVVGIGGDVSDLQTVRENLERLEIEHSYESASESPFAAKNIHMYLRRLLYQQRSKMDPLWNSVLVAGLAENEPFLGYVDLLGVTYESGALATGFGAHLAVPILRKLVDKPGQEKDVDEETAVNAIKQCMKVLFYRDGRAMDRFSLAVVTKDGVRIEDVECQDQRWDFAEDVVGFGV